MIETFVVAGVEVHPFNVTVTLYTPLIAAVAFGRTGFCDVLINPPGPVHEYAAPGDAEFAVKLSAFPLQMGPLLFAVGAAGAAGVVSVKGPIAFDTHPLREAVILSYTPPDKLEIIIVPLAFDVNVIVVGAPPFFV
jgi:hypothetical protein